MSYSNREKEAWEELSQFIDDSISEYKDAIKSDFLRVEVTLGEHVGLADLDVLLRTIEPTPELEDCKTAVADVLKEMATHAIEIERSRMPDYPLLFADQGWGLIGYRPENAWEEAKFLETEVNDYCDSIEPNICYPVFGSLVMSGYLKPEFYSKFKHRACSLMKKLRDRDDGFTDSIFLNYELMESLSIESPYTDIDLYSCSGLNEYWIREELRSQPLDDETWVE